MAADYGSHEWWLGVPKGAMCTPTHLNDENEIVLCQFVVPAFSLGDLC